MKKTYLKWQTNKAVIVLLLALIPFLSKAQIDVHVTILPPYPSKLSDYLSRPQQVLLMVHNGSNINQNIQLRGEFAGDNGISIRADQNYKSSTPVRLGPNETRTLGINDVQSLFDVNKVTFSGITKSQFISQNGVPEGNYQICVQAFDYYTNKPLSESSPLGCSNIFPVSNVEDPTIISPYDGQVVTALAGQNFVISWSTPSGAPPSAQYTVKIVEIFGDKSPADAFTSSMVPVFFKQTVIGINSLVYGPAMPAMTLGRHYAIAVTASDPANTVTFKNNGQSVITGFVYGTAPAVAVAAAADTTAVNTVATPIPVNTVGGSVSWYYLQSEENAPSGRADILENYPQPETPGTIEHKDVNGSIMVSVQPLYRDLNKTPTPVYPIIHNPVGSKGGHLAMAVHHVTITAADTLYSGSTFNTTTDANGNFLVPIAGVAERMSQNTTAAFQALNLAPTDSIAVSIISQRTEGTGFATFGPYYYPVSALNNGASLNLGKLKATALTFRFRPIVTDAQGNELTDAEVDVYRRSDFYLANPDLIDEGNFEANQSNREQDKIDGVMYTKVASITSGHAATRLFFNSPANDFYKIQVTEGNHAPINTTLTLTGANAYLTGITIPATYAMQNEPTVFSGTVYKSINNTKSPAVGAVITLINNLHVFTGTTDSLGNFSIINGFSVDPYITHDVVAGIATSPQAQPFFVQYNGQTITDNIVMDKPYQAYSKQEVFIFTPVAVKGNIVDDKNMPLPNAIVRWASGSSRISTDAQGGFSTYNTEGTDTLIVSKEGYVDTHVIVTIANGIVYNKSNTPPPQPVRRGFFALATPIQSQGIFTGILNAINGSLGNIVMSPLTARMSITVSDNNGSPVANAVINVEGFPDQQNLTTDNNGHILIIGPAGDIVFDVQGPAGSNYVPLQIGAAVYADGTVHNFNFTLQQGVRLNGAVTANGAPIASATVGMQGQDFGAATTKADGTYSIVLPAGSYTLEASAPGYLADFKQGNYTASQTVNFSLSTSSLNIKTLLGFNVQVDVIKDNWGNTKLISGEFINIPSNTVFTVPAGTKIKFDEVPVTVQPDKTVIPVNNIVTTLQPSLSLKAFGYLPVTLTNDGDDDDNDAVYIQKTNGNHGQIMGRLGINFGNFLPPSGLAPYASDNFPASNSAQQTSLAATLTDDGSIPGNSALTLLDQGQPTIFNVDGFKIIIDLANSSIQSDGIHLAGSVDLSNIPLLSGTKLNIQQLWIGTDGSLKNLTAQPNVQINIAGWSAQVNSISFNQDGFNLGGSLTVQLPSTQGTTSIPFSNLQISQNALLGGSFNFPQQGINVFNIANVTGSNIAFGQLGNSKVYYLSGSGTINFTGAAASYINPVKLDAFQVQTNGQLAITATPNLQYDFFGGLASVGVTQLSINDVNGPPKIDLQGNFALNVPGLSATVGGIHFGSGGSVSVDNLGLGFDIAGIAKANVNVGFQNTAQQKGFSGSGDFNVAGFADIGCNFHYYKVPGGTDIGTTFSAGTYIPLGTSGLSITQLGGGFTANTAKNTWGVDINGTVAVGESSFASAFIDFSIANGPVITGSAKLNIASLNGIAQGKLTLDVPHSLFAVDIGAGINMSGLSANAGGRLVLSLDPGDKYFLLGTYADFSAFGLLNFSGSACLAYNLNTGKHARDLANYISAIPDFAKSNGQMFTGISALSSFNYSLDNILPNFNVDLGILDFGIHSYFDMGANGYVLAALVNNSSPTFSVGFGVNWACGGGVDFSVLDVFNASVGLGVGYNASFTGTAAFNPSYLSMQATASAYFHAYWGDISPGYCISGTNIPWYRPDHWWVSLCLTPSLTVGFDTRQSGFYMHF